MIKEVKDTSKIPWSFNSTFIGFISKQEKLDPFDEEIPLFDNNIVMINPNFAIIEHFLQLIPCRFKIGLCEKNPNIRIKY